MLFYIKNRRALGDTALCFIICCVIGIIIMFSDDAKAGARAGIELCEEIIIPSLLPVLILCNTIISSRLSRAFEICLGKTTEKLFGLPKVCAGAIILGLFSGFPAGAVLTDTLYKGGAIDEKDASKIMRFNFCGGAAFIITAVGSVKYSSVKAGLILYLVNVIAAIIVGLISHLTERKTDCVKSNSPTFSGLPFTDALTKSVEATVKALAVMSAYIILFSVFFGISNPPEYLVPILEITNGICRETAVPLEYTAFFLAFGGVCVHLQLFGFLRNMKVKYRDFLIGRIASAVISYFLFKLVILLFPNAVSVFSNINAPVKSFSSGGLALSLVMITGCAAVVFDIENRKIKLHSLL